uniref:Uncharacterized protein n=1 Tax=Prevotella sp. GTC17260 TaxID=3236796 RepID=A0AB33JHL9_9BACT
MRIQVVTSSAIKKETLSAQYISTMQHELTLEGTNFEDNKSVDLIHIMGKLDLALLRLIKTANSKKIPILYSPLASIVSWQHSPLQYALKKCHLTFHATGKHEKQYIQQHFQPHEVYLVKNPIVTNDGASSDLYKQLLELYTKVTSEHDQQIRRQIKQQVDQFESTDHQLQTLCNEFLYAQYLFHRDSLNPAFAQQLADKMQTADYNEDLMGEILQKLEIYSFVASLEQAMLQTTTLTEGFIPIPAIDNRTARKIAEMITHKN